MQKTIWPMTIWLKIVKLGLALACFAVLLTPFAVSGQQSGKQSGSKSAPAEPTTVAPPPVKKPVDYNRFTHETHLGEVKVPNTNFARKLNCQSCHERPTAQDSSKSIVANTDRNKQLILKFP